MRSKYFETYFLASRVRLEAYVFAPVFLKSGIIARLEHDQTKHERLRIELLVKGIIETGLLHQDSISSE